MSKECYGYCSWCFKKTRHALLERNVVRRNVYQCQNCHNATLGCRLPSCENMTKAGPKWDDEFCAEHDGTIASFDTLSVRLDDLAGYGVIFERRTYNWAKVTQVAVGTLAGLVVFGPLVYFAAPGLAAALGSAGFLGTASTGTAISTLSGAALTSASVAAIGGGTMAAGMVFITAAGAALGGINGAVVSNNYFRDVKDFRIVKVKGGKGPALIFINGFLSQEDQDSSDWEDAVKTRFPHSPWYFVIWEAKNLHSLGSLVTRDGTGKAFSAFLTTLAKRASRKAASKLNPLTWAAIFGDLASNPWHTAMVRASKTGVLLADLLARTRDSEFILMGNSLGCRVIYYTLVALSTRDSRCVKDVYLLGGAVDRKDETGWKSALGAVSGRIYNCYSHNDNVLRYFYKPANLFLSNPIGLDAITYQNERIINTDVSDLVDGHMRYKEKFSAILKRLSVAHEGRKPLEPRLELSPTDTSSWFELLSQVNTPHEAELLYAKCQKSHENDRQHPGFLLVAGVCQAVAPPPQEAPSNLRSAFNMMQRQAHIDEQTRLEVARQVIAQIQRLAPASVDTALYWVLLGDPSPSVVKYSYLRAEAYGEAHHLAVLTLAQGVLKTIREKETTQ